MNRLAGIVVAAVGLIVCVLSILKVIPGLTQAGVMMILLGGLIIGLSFVDKPGTDEQERMSTPGTLAGMFFSPTEVFRDLRRHPRWLVAALIMTLLSVTFTNLFMYRLTPERVANYAIDKSLEMSFLNDDMRKEMEKGRAPAIEDAKNPVSRAGSAVSSFAGSVFYYAFMALVFMLFCMAMGGKIHFWQSFAAVVYASFPVAVLRFILNTTVLFLKDPTDIHPLLGQGSLIQDNLNFLVLPSEHPVIFTILSAFSLLMFYWIWLLATGLKNTGEKVSSTAAWSAAIAIFFVILIFGAGMAAVFPSFMS